MVFEMIVRCVCMMLLLTLPVIFVVHSVVLVPNSMTLRVGLGALRRVLSIRCPEFVVLLMCSVLSGRCERFMLLGVTEHLCIDLLCSLLITAVADSESLLSLLLLRIISVRPVLRCRNMCIRTLMRLVRKMFTRTPG